MENSNLIREKIGYIEQDLMAVKKLIIGMDAKTKGKTEKAWSDMLNASKEISKQWKGSVVDEIRSQRKK